MVHELISLEPPHARRIYMYAGGHGEPGDDGSLFMGRTKCANKVSVNLKANVK